MKAAAVGASALALGSVPASADYEADESCEGEYEEFEVGSGDFAVMNNQWTSDGTEQCIYVEEDGSYGWTFEAPTAGPNYPEVYIGERPWGEDTEVPEFQDLQRGDIDELTVEYDFDLDINPDAEWNLALEWWLMSEPVEPITGDEDPPHTHEMMLVFDHSDEHSHGQIQEHDVWTDEYGNTVHLWDDDVIGGTDARFFVFVLEERSQSGTVDLTAMIDYLTEQYGIQDDLYFTGVELGTEIWEGAGGEAHVNSFDVTINGTEYESGSDAETTPSVPSAPDDVSATDVGEDWIEIEWDDVDDAETYTVTLDGDEVDETDATSTTITGLSPGTSYEVGVSAENDAGSSSAAETAVTTDDDGECADDELELAGNCTRDTTGSGLHNDITGDGSTSHDDVTTFFEEVNSDAVQDNPEAFAFAGDEENVGFNDVLALFEKIS